MGLRGYFSKEKRDQRELEREINKQLMPTRSAEGVFGQPKKLSLKDKFMGFKSFEEKELFEKEFMKARKSQITKAAKEKGRASITRLKKQQSQSAFNITPQSVQRASEALNMGFGYTPVKQNNKKKQQSFYPF